MKNKILSLFIIVLGLQLTAQEKSLVRLYAPSEDAIQLFLRSSYDIAESHADNYVDAVLTEAQMAELESQGWRLQIIQTEAQMRQNLSGENRDIPGYRDYQELINELNQLAVDYPEIIQLTDIGDSWGKIFSEEGNENYDAFQHEIWQIKLSDNVNIQEDEPAVYYMGAHHAREPISLEVAMYVLNHLVSNYGSNPDVTNWVNTTEIFFIPLVNPNGHRIVTEQYDLWWRKNIADNTGDGMITYGTGGSYPDGVDPNRNYSFEWGGEGAGTDMTAQNYRGPYSASEPEIQAMLQLMSEHHFVCGITYHSYSELVLHPFGYSSSAIAPDADALFDLANEMAISIPSIEGSGHYTPSVSYGLYPASGTTDDYAYGRHGIFSFTIELATQFIPPQNQVNTICEDNLEAALILLDRVNQRTLTGHVTDAETNEVVQAVVFVDGIDNQGSFREDYTADEAFGRYYRLLEEGNYSVSFSAYGYLSETFQDIAILPDQQTILDVQLTAASSTEVSGKVSSESGNLLAGVKIEILDTPIEPVYTDDNGAYMFDEVFEGSYNFKITAEGYKTMRTTEYIDSQNNIFDFQLIVSSAESFEEGIIPETYTSTGNQVWFVENNLAWDGDYSLRSGDISNNQSSSLMTAFTASQAGDVVFYCKVSSEADYDYLRFYLNGEEKASWSGEMDWTEYYQPVEAGAHQLEWVYTKDVYVSEGGDCGWIDYVELPPLVTGMDMFEAENPYLVVYPNPAGDWATIEFRNTAGNGRVEIFDLQGRMIKTLHYHQTSGSLRLPVTSYEPGIYFIRLYDKGNIAAASRFIIR